MALHITPAEAARKTPSSRNSNVTYTAGAHTTTVSIPSGTTYALIGICMYNDTSLQPPTSVTLDSQSATLIDSGGTTSTTQVAIYKVSGFATGASKTLAYTVGSSGTFFGMDIAVEYRDGTPSYGAHGTSAVTGSGPASTSGLANTSGDEFSSIYCSRDTVGTQNPSVGTGQSKYDETWDSSGSIRYGFSTETGTGSADVQTIAAGGTGNIPSIAATVITTTSNASFTVAPVYATVSNTQISTTFTASSAGLTYYCALYARGASAPTAAQIMAGTNAHSSVITGSTSGSSESHNMTASDSPTFPRYDPYCVLYNGGTPGTVATTSTTQTTPPSTCGLSSNQACQYVILSSVAVGGIASVATLAYDGQTANFVVGETVTGGTSGAIALVQADTDAGATGTLTLWVSSGTFQDNEALTGSVNGVAVVNGTATYAYAANDVLVAPTYVSPAGASYPLTILADGTGVYDAFAYDANVGRETAMNIKVYDDSAVGYASNDIDWVNNNSSPSCSGLTITEDLVKNQPMTSIDWDNLCVDAESDTLNSIAVGTQPTGISLNGTTNVVSGTPTVENAGVTIKYVVYDTYGAIGFRSVLYTVVSVVYKVTPDCVTAPAALEFCEALYDTALLGDVTFTEGLQCSSTVTSGTVIATSPKPGAQIPTGSNVSITSSTGPCLSTKMVNCLSKTASACQALLTTAYAAAYSLVQTTASCPAAYASGIIFAQSPGPGSKVGATGTLTVNICP